MIKWSKIRMYWCILECIFFILLCMQSLNVVSGLVFLEGVLVGSHVCVFRHGVRHLIYSMQSQSVYNCDFTSLCWTKNNYNYKYYALSLGKVSYYDFQYEYHKSLSRKNYIIFFFVIITTHVHKQINLNIEIWYMFRII